MGLSKRLRDLSKEYMRDPKGQYFRHLKKILDLSVSSGVNKQEVKSKVDEWLQNSR